MRNSKLWLLLAVCGLTGVWCASSQTKVDLQLQSRLVDFSGAPSTKPASVVTTLPATCGVGQVAFLSTATAGQNLYLCAALNTWTQVVGNGSGGGGGSSTKSLVSTTSNTITMAAGTILSSTGQSIFVTSATITATGGTDTGSFTVGYNSAGQRVCFYSAGISAANYAVSGFAGSACTTPVPAAGIYVAGTVVITSGVFSAPTDFRADAFAITLACGTNLTTISGGGCAVDPTSTLAWSGAVNFTGASASSPVRFGASNPSTCNVGEMFVNTSSGVALEFCTATNTYTQIH